MNEQERPHPVYARVQGTPYGVPNWPGRVGFTLEPQSGVWVRDAWTLKQEDAKHWLLSHPDWKRGRRIVTNCRHPESIALDLAWQVREAVEAS